MAGHVNVGASAPARVMRRLGDRGERVSDPSAMTVKAPAADAERMPSPDPSTLPGLLGSAGKSMAHLPGARGVLERLRRADSPEALAGVLQSVDIGLEEPARALIQRAALDPATWREVHSSLVRSAELQLHDRFSSSA